MSDALVTPRPRIAHSDDQPRHHYQDQPHNKHQQNQDQGRHRESAATRHLCVGVYLDRDFRDRVIRKIHNDSRRLVAPSYGFDLIPVVRHAWRSWFLDAAQQLAIVISLLVALLMGGVLAVVLVACGLAGCYLLPWVARLTWQVVRARVISEAEWWGWRFKPRQRPRSGRTKSRLAAPRGELQSRTRLLKLLLAGCAALVVVPVVSANLLGVSLGEAATAALSLLGVLLVCALAAGIVRQFQLNGIHNLDTLRPATLTRREADLNWQQSHPCVVYRRPEHTDDVLDPLDIAVLDDDDVPSPFMGSGKLVHRWLPPMTVQLLRRGADEEPIEEREYSELPFKAHALVEALRQALQKLGADPDTERLDDLTVRDRVYVAEVDVSSDRKLLECTLPEDVMEKLINNHNSTAHHFLETSVSLAGGELVTTILVRVSVKGRSLSLDVATCALTRTPQQYQRIDAFAEHGPGAVARSALRAVLDLPADLLRLWQLTLLPWVLVRAWWARTDRTQRRRRGITVGPQVAVRQEKADPWEDAQLDETAVYDHMKIIEQRILKAAEGFLHAHGVDTSVFKRQATSIINSGVLNMGGRTEVKQSAVGTSAQVTQHAAGANDSEGADE